MSGCIVQVWFEDEVPESAQKARWDIIETDFADFAAFLEAVDADRLICVDRLYTRYTETRGEREIVRRAPMAFRGSVVRRAELPTWRFVEAGQDGAEDAA